MYGRQKCRVLGHLFIETGEHSARAAADTLSMVIQILGNEVRKAGEALLNYIDNEGYIRTPLETIQAESKSAPSIDALNEAIVLLQTLEPAGVGARGRGDRRAATPRRA